jgi:NitT/TauT family transport system permease protein
VNGRRLLGAVAPPVVLGVVLVGAWEALVKGLDLKPYFLPSPSSVADAFADNAGLVRDAVIVSGTNALVGLLGGVVLGIAFSFLLMRFDILNELANPLAVALNAIPIVVIVSVFQNMYSSTSEMPRRLIVAVVVYFIVLVNVSKGLRGVSATHLELLRSLAAPPRAVLTKARIPNAVPFLFTALKIAAPTAVITAFVAEYFGGRQNGLGYFIPSNFANSKTAMAWAYVLGACLLGLGFYLVSILLERITNSRGRAPGGA